MTGYESFISRLPLNPAHPKREALPVALFTHHSASDNEIKSYINFYNSGAGQWLKVSQQPGWQGALRNIGRGVAWKMRNSSDNSVQTA